MQLISCFVLLNLFSLLPLIWLSYRELWEQLRLFIKWIGGISGFKLTRI
jgi:hypothetical protein